MPTSHVEPLWLTEETVVAINKLEVASNGDPHRILDLGKLSGALGRPLARFHYAGEDDLVELASVLLFAVARCHAFIQGNKRSGWTAFNVFLEMNGYCFAGPDTDHLGAIITAVIEGNHGEAQFADIVRPHIVPLVD